MGFALRAEIRQGTVTSLSLAPSCAKLGFGHQNTDPMTMESMPNAAPHPGDTKARYIMIGGFLGAGKTTAVGQLARWLDQGGRRVGLITNDQGSHLVDTATQLAKGFPVE